MVPEDAPARIRSVRIRKYKNLTDLWLPWSDGLAIFGANGVGKSNLLEALTVLFGDEDSVRELHGRVQDVARDMLEAVLEVPATELPWAPDLVAGVDLDAHAGPAEYPGMLRAHIERTWWSTIGATCGADLLEGLESLGLPDVVLNYLGTQLIRPTIRYTLSEASYSRLTVDGPGGELTLSRSYGRTLLGTMPPGEVRAIADHLPEAFAPLRTALASAELAGDDGLVDLLALPAVAEVPVVLQWLPRSRTSLEADEALIRAVQTAKGPAERLAAAIGKLDIARDTYGNMPTPDAEWWLQETLARAANDELDRTIPGHVLVEPEGGGDADINLRDARQSRKYLGRSGDEHMLDLLSAGERRWVDEALATAARELRAFGDRAGAFAQILLSTDPDEIVPELLGIADVVGEQVRSDEYMSSEALQLVLDTIEPRLRAIAASQVDERDNALARTVLENLYGLAALRPPTTIRVFDEPEAHLHAGAQRNVAAALEATRRAGGSAVIATHSPQFLDMPGWSLVHLQRTPEGPTLQPLSANDLDARKALAGQMGFTRGELLARVTFVLIVEGEHDRLVLETLFGDRLDASGICIARMHGTGNLLATAELDFLGRFFDVPIAVLTDYTRVDRVGDLHIPENALTDEEKALRSLHRIAKERGREIKQFGLRRPDITAYLNEEAVAAANPRFPGWQHVLDEFGREPRRSFKRWLYLRHDTDLQAWPRINATLEAMAAGNLPPEKELTACVENIIRYAATGAWQGQTGNVW